MNARKICLKHYGFKCIVCGFDFESNYGEIGKKFIHVHHEKELSLISQDYEIDPISDMKPVCPNCHSMLHRRRPAYSIKELKEMLTNKTLCVIKRSCSDLHGFLIAVLGMEIEKYVEIISY